MAYKADVHQDDFVKSGLEEGTKSWFGFDGSGRLQFEFMGPTYMKDGDPCLVTEYSYVGATAVIQARKEYIGTWISATMDF